MKRCPTCNKDYDDTWKVCLVCEEALVESAGSSEGDALAPKETAIKRPNGVVFLAWWMIITSIFAIITVQTSMKINPPASTIFYMILSPISIIVAIYLLKLKEWARVAMIVIALMIVTETAITTPYAARRMKADMMSQIDIASKESRESVKAKDRELAASDPARIEKFEQFDRKMRTFASSAADMLIAILVMVSILAYLGIAYYFSLTKIRGYFSST